MVAKAAVSTTQTWTLGLCNNVKLYTHLDVERVRLATFLDEKTDDERVESLSQTIYFDTGKRTVASEQ